MLCRRLVFCLAVSPVWPHFLHTKTDLCFKDFIYLFLERGERKEQERERNINVQEKDGLPLSHPQLGTWPATQDVPQPRIKPATFLPAGHTQSTESTSQGQIFGLTSDGTVGFTCGFQDVWGKVPCDGAQTARGCGNECAGERAANLASLPGLPQRHFLNESVSPPHCSLLSLLPSVLSGIQIQLKVMQPYCLLLFFLKM